MAKRGRKREPTIKLIARGSKRAKYDRPKNEPVPIAGMPSPPEWLQGEGLAEWNRKAPLLYEQGTLALVDDVILAAYCRSWQMFVEIEQMMQKQKLVISRKNGSKMKNPLAAMRNEALDRMVKLASELGIGASSRSGINLPKPKSETENKSQSWIEKHNQGA